MCCEIFVVIIVGYKKNRKKRGSAGSLPSAADGKDPFAVGGRRQRGHVAPTCASWGGPFGQFADSGERQSLADGKDFAFAVRRADGKKNGR